MVASSAPARQEIKCRPDVLLHRQIVPRKRRSNVNRYGSVEKPLAKAPPLQLRVLRSGSPRLGRTMFPTAQDVCGRIDDGNCFVRTARDGVRDAEQFYPSAFVIYAAGDGSAHDRAGIFFHPQIAGNRAMEDESFAATNCRASGNPAVKRDILVERERAIDVAVNCLHFSYSKRSVPYLRRQYAAPGGIHAKRHSSARTIREARPYCL